MSSAIVKPEKNEYLKNFRIPFREEAIFLWTQVISGSVFQKIHDRDYETNPFNGKRKDNPKDFYKISTFITGFNGFRIF